MTRRVARLIAVALAVTTAACHRSPTATGEESISATPAFADEFSGSALDTRIWSTCYWWADPPEDGCTNAGNNELQWYLPDGVRVQDGALHLIARDVPARGTDGRDYRYRSGMVQTIDRRREMFTFLYGYVEIRARVPAGTGLWSAFWLLNADRTSKPEIDLFEVLGEDTETLRMHVHTEDRSVGHSWRGTDLSDGWHTYGLRWEPDSLRFYLDGIERWAVTDPDLIPSVPMYLIADLAVGGDYPEPPDSTTPFPSRLLVDHVRVFDAR